MRPIVQRCEENVSASNWKFPHLSNRLVHVPHCYFAIRLSIITIDSVVWHPAKSGSSIVQCAGQSPPSKPRWSEGKFTRQAPKSGVDPQKGAPFLEDDTIGHKSSKYMNYSNIDGNKMALWLIFTWIGHEQWAIGYRCARPMMSTLTRP